MPDVHVSALDGALEGIESLARLLVGGSVLPEGGGNASPFRGFLAAARQRDRSLQPGQWSADAVMNAAGEGQVVGRVRREGKRWHAVVPGAAKPVATRRTRRAAVVALARACADSVGRADSAGCAETAEQPRRPGWWPLLVHQR